MLVVVSSIKWSKCEVWNILEFAVEESDNAAGSLSTLVSLLVFVFSEMFCIFTSSLNVNGRLLLSTG